MSEQPQPPFPLLPDRTAYRAYIIGPEGHILSFQTIEASSDEEAVDKTKVLCNSHGIDLWKDTRYLGSFPPLKPGS